MPRENYTTWYYEELPEGCKAAAASMGYADAAHWDEDKPVGFDTKKFEELTLTEKRAAIFLGWDIWWKKLDIWWNDADEDTKNAARAIGWTQEAWDEDWNIQDLPIEHKYWSDLTEAERTGASYFGYTQITWDETETTEWTESGDDVAPAPKPSSEQEEKKDDFEVEEEEVDEEEATAEAEAPKKKKIRFIKSKVVGGSGGDSFDDGNHRKIKKITVWSDARLRGIQMTYENGEADRHGVEAGKMHEVEVADGQYINKVSVVANDEIVLKLTLWSNTGDELGHFGRETGRLMQDKRGEETVLEAPRRMQLCGIFGSSGALIDNLGFRWGTVRN